MAHKEYHSIPSSCEFKKDFLRGHAVMLRHQVHGAMSTRFSEFEPEDEIPADLVTQVMPTSVSDAVSGGRNI